jgi:glucose-6-phosphate isomerase
MQNFEPFTTQLNLKTGNIQPAAKVIRRRLSDMCNFYFDEETRRRIEKEEGDRLVYEVFVTHVPEEEGHVLYGTTVIYPGFVGDEFHMTKGHFHNLRDRAEVYMGIAGIGSLILQTEGGIVRSLKMEKGTIAYVPPYWAHRTVNTGDQPFVFFAAWPGEAGHDYGTIEESGFAKIAVFRDDQVLFVDNPKYK